MPNFDSGAQALDQPLTDEGLDLWTTPIRYHSVEGSPGLSATWPHTAIDTSVSQSIGGLFSSFHE